MVQIQSNYKGWEPKSPIVLSSSLKDSRLEPWRGNVSGPKAGKDQRPSSKAVRKKEFTLIQPFGSIWEFN